MKKLMAMLGMLAFLVPSVALAANFQSTSLVAKDAQTGNLYVANQSVTVDANVNGDLNTAGGNVTVNGTVAGDVHAAAGTLNLKGSIEKNAYVAGGTVNVDGNLGGDLLIFGGTVTVNSTSTIAGDLVVFGGTVTMNGKVNGRVYGSAGTFDLNGTVAKSLELKNVGTVTLGSTAVVGGDFIYNSQTKAIVTTGASVAGQTKYIQVKTVNVEKERTPWGKIAGFSLLFSFVGTFLLLAVVMLVAPKKTKSVIESSLSKPWANLGIGLVAAIVAPILLLLVLITFFGAAIAGIGFVAYFAMIATAGVLSSLVLGSSVKKFFTKAKEYPLDWATVLIATALAILLKLVPVLGWLVLTGFFLIVFGQLTNDLFAWIKGQK